MKNFEDVSHEERIERWENVLRVLSNLSPHERRKHWNMSVWGEKTDCGTVACAAGHCGLDPWFRRQGVKLVFNKDSFGEFYGDVTNVEEFLGSEGYDDIFTDTDRRSVGKVIKEVKQYIKKLKIRQKIDELEDFINESRENIRLLEKKLV